MGQTADVRRRTFLLFALTYVVWGGWNWFIDRPVHTLDGILAPAEPQQEEIAGAEPVRLGRWTLTPRASYRITARVLGVERYQFDALSPLIPEDLALGWGPMSNNRILLALEISQGNRFYFWHVRDSLQISRDVLISHSANTHVIPDGPLVTRQLSRLRAGQVVTLTGVLVDGRRDDGATISTSMVRTDTGAGSCEVMLVHELELLP